jgi:hypothetical protein
LFGHVWKKQLSSGIRPEEGFFYRFRNQKMIFFRVAVSIAMNFPLPVISQFIDREICEVNALSLAGFHHEHIAGNRLGRTIRDSVKG